MRRTYPSLLRLLVLWQSLALAMALGAMSVVLYVSIALQLRSHHDQELIRTCEAAGELVEVYDELYTAGEIHLYEHVAELGANVRLERLEWEELPEGTVLGEIELSTFYRDESEVENALDRPPPDLLPPLEPSPTARGRAPAPPAPAAPAIPVHSHALEAGDVRLASGYFEAAEYGLVYRVDVEEGLGDVDSTLQRLETVMLTAGPLVLLLAIGVVALILRGSLRPLRNVVTTLRAMDVDQLGERIEVASRTQEIDVLVRAFNQMLQRLHESFENLSEFTANASHELRTPLTSLRSSLEVTLDKVRTAEDYRVVLVEALGEVKHLTRIVENLLVLAQTNAGRVHLETEPVDVAGLVLDSVDAIHLREEAAGISLEVREAPEGEACVVRGDPHWLRQLFDNLLDNALKYTPPGGTVSVSTRSHNGSVEVVVADTGVGIAAEDLAEVFQRYRRGGGETQKAPGIGLGLSIAEWVAEAHHGRIEVTSAPGAGSEFRVSLPRDRDEGGSSRGSLAGGR